MRNLLIKTALATGVIVFSGQFVFAQQDQSAAASNSYPSCTQQTVDVYGKAEGIEYRWWMLRLQTAVKDDDRRSIGEGMVMYPLTWNRKEGTVVIKSKSEFLKNYDEIFNPELRSKVLSQNVKCLPGDDEGANVGSGALRYSKFAANKTFQITSITQANIKTTQKLPWE